jgi:SAM-dependent methyltransferase
VKNIEPQQSDVQSSYDRVAGEYVLRIFDELKHKPIDRALLDQFAESVRGCGPVCDMGCGPGQVARYLHERGVEVSGVDLSPVMVEHARRLNPEIAFKQGNMLSLEVDDEAWAGIAAFYSIIHIPREELVSAFQELKRVLRPGGLLLLAFHIGDTVVHMDEWWGQPVSVDFAFYFPEEITGYLTTAGFVVQETYEREPIPDVEHQSRRAYLFARKRQQGESGPVPADSTLDRRKPTL